MRDFDRYVGVFCVFCVSCTLYNQSLSKVKKARGPFVRNNHKSPDFKSMRCSDGMAD